MSHLFGAHDVSILVSNPRQHEQLSRFAYAGFLPCMTVGEFNQLQMQWDVQGRFDHPPANESQLGDIIGADDGDIYLECLERK